tara:strand:+ start:8 stop:283 length:276 start_codon:yes stop_codon:yes gene_type:complete
MLNKMLLITSLLLPYLLIAKVNTVHAEEANKLEVSGEANEEHPIVDMETTIEASGKQNNTNGNDKRSIKMIVGGQSKDGVAKSIDLPVSTK